jgi:hypothetical protein
MQAEVGAAGRGVAQPARDAVGPQDPSGNERARGPQVSERESPPVTFSSGPSSTYFRTPLLSGDYRAKATTDCPNSFRWPVVRAREGSRTPDITSRSPRTPGRRGPGPTDVRPSRLGGRRVPLFLRGRIGNPTHGLAAPNGQRVMRVPGRADSHVRAPQGLPGRSSSSNIGPEPTGFGPRASSPSGRS